MDAAFLAVDWGTTNRRVFAVARDGSVVARGSDDRGLATLAADGFPAEAQAIRAAYGDLPMLCAGMVGSRRGWHEIPYRPCPASLDDLVAALHWVEPGRTAIVPGVSVIAGERGDVIRGEEVQFLGAVEAGLAPADALMCQPGTHCKWAVIRQSRIADFRTMMTGELFALLRRDSLLAEFLTGDVADGPDFREGLAEAGNARLLSSLFGVRAGTLLNLRAPDRAAAFVSGLMIGSDVREQRIASGTSVYILAEGTLAALYAAAVESVGGVPVSVDSSAAFVAGINAIWSRSHANPS